MSTRRRFATPTPASGRPGGWISALSLAAIVPHLLEDLAYGLPDDLGLERTTAFWLAGLVVGLHLVVALASVEGRRWGSAGVLLVAIGWILAALWDHPGAFLPDEFRNGFPSRAWVWLLIGSQGFAALWAWRALRRRRF